MKGTLENIGETKSPKFKTVTIDGKKYGVQSELIEAFTPPMEVEFESEQKGKFHNILSIGSATVGYAPKSFEPTMLEPPKFDDLMLESLLDSQKIFNSPDLTEEFKKHLDWNDIGISIFISRTRCRN